MTVLKIALKILAPIFFISFIIGGILLYFRCRKTRKKRNSGSRDVKIVMETGNEQSMPNLSVPLLTGNWSHELRAIAAGDSTLKVTYTFIIEF